MTAPTIHYDARLALIGDLDESPILPGSWFVTHPLGKPAGGTYTEVAFAPHERPRIVTEEVVRRVATDLYGTAWAFLYSPDRYADAIERWGMRRRERVLVTDVEVWS